MSWLSNYFLPPGDGVIGGAIVSIVLLVVPAMRVWFKHLRPHIRKTHEIHQYLTGQKRQISDG